jgi:hypothetical protein
MADQSTNITSPVKIKPDSEARVALDLAKIIAIEEETEKTREYWLTLYYQCRMAARGKDKLENIIKAHSPSGAELLTGRR